MRGVIDPGNHRFRPRFVRVYMYGRISGQGLAPHPLRVALALRTQTNQQSDRGWGFHTVRRGIDPGNHRFRPRFVGIVDVWKDF